MVAYHDDSYESSYDERPRDNDQLKLISFSNLLLPVRTDGDNKDLLPDSPWDTILSTAYKVFNSSELNLH